MPDIRLSFQAPQPRPFARTPTPIQPLPRLSELLGAQIFCKRDDLTGFGFGGNKIRKLEYLLSEALRLGSDSLVTCGSNQSNWCCMVAVAGAVLGMEVHLLLGGAAPASETGNLRLDRIAGACITHVETEDDAVLEEAASERAVALAGRGLRPYRMTMGGSIGIGSLGYAHALREVMTYEQATGTHFSKIIHASGSGGTQAGLVAGALLHGWKGDIIGMAISRSADAQEIKVRGILSQMFAEDIVRDAKVTVDDRFVGGGYRHKTTGCTEAIAMFARMEGIFLDEVYTGKAAAGLIAYGRAGQLGKDENILFLHTGGTAQLFE